MTPIRASRKLLAVLALACVAVCAAPAPRSEGVKAATRANTPLAAEASPGRPAAASESLEAAIRKQAMASGPTLVLFAAASLLPAAVLMVTAFVRIHIVLTLLRQALGSQQVPGNQVVLGLALMLTALVMKPVAQDVYTRGIEPLASRKMGVAQAWDAATRPIKIFMVDQICRTRHQDYLWQLYDYAEPPGPGRADPTEYEQFPLRVVAPAFLLSELTTALTIGFLIYLPFLVVDLVVSAVLAAMGLYMLPPSLVALPLKLILFVLADGWMLVAGMLLRSFGGGSVA